MPRRKIMYPTAKYYQGKKVPGKKREKLSKEELSKFGITAKKHPANKRNG